MRQEAKCISYQGEWYLISLLGSGRATVLELSHTGFDGRRASTGQTAKHTRSSLWCYNLWNIRQDRKIIHISYQKTTTSLQRQKKNREWNGSSQNLKRFCAKTCPAKQEVMLRRAPTMMLCRDLPGIKPTPNQLFGDLCVNLASRWQPSMSLESLSNKPI